MTDTPAPLPDAYLSQDEAIRLKTILEGTAAGTWEWNVQTGETVFNERWAEIIGYTLDELQPVSINTWMAFAHPDDLAQSSQRLDAHFNGETPYYECEARMRHRDGHWVWVRDYGRLVSRTPDGKPEWVCGTHIDISTSKAYEQELERVRAEQAATIYRLEKMASLIPGVIFQFEIKPDGSMRFPYASAGIERIYDVTPDQVLKDATMVFNAIHPEDRERVGQSIRRSQETGHDWVCEYRVINHGQIIWVFGQSRPEFQKDGTVVWHGTILDITDQKDLEQRLRNLATTDELTGAANRRHFMDLLGAEFQRLQRRGAPYSLILIDFDWFKRVNDQYGHSGGDQVLQAFSSRVQQELRSTETLARIGGEEFALLVPNADTEQARTLAERLRLAVASLRYHGLDDFAGTITCGIAASSADDRDPGDIILRADKAMYEGKAQGRNRVVVYGESSSAS